MFGGSKYGWLAAALLLLALLASLPFAIAHLRHAPVEERVVRLSFLPPERTGSGSLAVSPDGRWLALTTGNVSSVTGREKLWVRALAAATAQELPGTEGAAYPFWSPDSAQLGFFAQGKLKKIALAGGLPITLCAAPDSRGGTWSCAGTILFAPRGNAGIQRVAASGGEPAVVTTPDQARQELSHRWPWFLPDSEHFLYLVTVLRREETAIYLGALSGGASERLMLSESEASFAASTNGNGYLLFVREGMLLAQPFDPTVGRLLDDPIRLGEQFRANGHDKGVCSASNNGVLVIEAKGNNSSLRQTGWFDRTGKLLGLLGSPGIYLEAAIAPDGKRAALARLDDATKTADLWLLDLPGGAESRFTFNPGGDRPMVWSPDSKQIVWSSNRSGPYNLYRRPTSGAEQEELLFKSARPQQPHSWSSDGRFILFRDEAPQTKLDLWLLPLTTGERQPISWLRTQFNETNGRFSPDAKWIAYTSDESGSNEIYVQAFQPSQSSGGKWQISNGGGDEVRWRRDGKELFYSAPDRKLMAVEIRSGASFEAGAPTPLFDLRSIKAVSGNYDAAGDGRRFLIVTGVDETAAVPCTLVLNWAAAPQPDAALQRP